MKLHLFKFEFRKLFKTHAFYVCLVTLLVFSALEILLLAMLDSILFGNYEYAYNPCLGETIPFLPIYSIVSICTCIYANKDRAAGTIKNIYSRGVSRSSYFFTRLVVSILASTIFFVSCILFEYIFSSLLYKVWKLEEVTKYFVLAGYEYAVVLVSTFLAMFITSSSKKTALSIIFCILAPSVLTLILNVADVILILKDIEFDNFTLGMIDYGSYPTTYLDFYNSNFKELPHNFHLLGVSICSGWSALLIFGAYMCSKKDQM